jgi:hypothetical protein
LIISLISGSGFGQGGHGGQEDFGCSGDFGDSDGVI